MNEKRSQFNSNVARSLALAEREAIDWVSPLKSDEYAEYRDQAFLDKLEIRLEKNSLDEFWPARGPQWDALGKTSLGKVLLVEAKSHIPELISSLQAERTESKAKIQRSLEATKLAFSSHADVDWSKRFYQYTNRLAHLRLLRMNDVPAYLVFVYFVNDAEMRGPSTASEWQGAERLLHSYLGIGRHKLQKFIANVYLDVQELQ